MSGPAHDLVEAWVDILDLRGGHVVLLGELAGEEFVENDAGGENIGPGIDRARALGHLRGGVVRCSEDDAFSLGFLREAGQTEVSDFRAFFPIQEDIGGFDVTVENACFVGVGETFADSGHQTGDLSLFNGLAVGGVVE